jgi:adenosine deaminase
MKHQVADFHMHLSGSFTLAFLKKCAYDSLEGDAEESHATKAYQLFVLNAAEVETLRKQGDFRGLVRQLFKQFDYIYDIVKVDHIVAGVRDVVESSNATYQEIRNTPKLNDDGSINYDSIAAFAEGLSQDYEGKEVWGVLGIDRTKFDLVRAKKVVDSVAREEKFVAIDVSGNPVAPRKLTGEGLTALLSYALDKKVGITIHIGEVDSGIERDEVEGLLNFLESRGDTKTSEARQANNIIVRVGHGRYLTEDHKAKIKALGLPIEYTETCYKTLGWPLGVVGLFNSPVDVLSGTDDSILFNCNAEGEMKAARIQTDTNPNDKELTQAQIEMHGFRPGVAV